MTLKNIVRQTWKPTTLLVTAITLLKLGCLPSTLLVTSFMMHVATIYGMFFWLTHFITQKRIDNLSANAQIALKSLPELRDLVQKCNRAIHYQDEDTLEHLALKQALYLALNKLRVNLLLLEKDHNLLEAKPLTEIKTIVEKLHETVLHKYAHAMSTATLIDFLTEINCLDVHKPNTTLLATLEQALLSLHQIPQ